MQQRQQQQLEEGQEQEQEADTDDPLDLPVFNAETHEPSEIYKLVDVVPQRLYDQLNVELFDSDLNKMKNALASKAKLPDEAKAYAHTTQCTQYTQHMHIAPV